MRREFRSGLTPRPVPASRSGYSLIEAILACFLLVFTFFLVSRLFHGGFQLARQVDARMTAVRLAEKRMDIIRRWAKTTKDWSGPPSSVTSLSDASFPGYRVDVTLRDMTVLSPCRELEQAYDIANRRNLPTVAKQALIKISKPGTKDFTLSALVTKGEADWGDTADLRISPSTATITGSAQEVEFRVNAYDEDGDEDRDVLFHWEVEPNFSTGNPSTAEVRLKTRDGRRVIMRNRVRRRSGLWIAQNGACVLVAYARYRGSYRRGTTGVITLVAP